MVLSIMEIPAELLQLDNNLPFPVYEIPEVSTLGKDPADYPLYMPLAAKESVSAFLQLFPNNSWTITKEECLREANIDINSQLPVGFHQLVRTDGILLRGFTREILLHSNFQHSCVDWQNTMKNGVDTMIEGSPYTIKGGDRRMLATAVKPTIYKSGIEETLDTIAEYGIDYPSSDKSRGFYATPDFTYAAGYAVSASYQSIYVSREGNEVDVYCRIKHRQQYLIVYDNNDGEITMLGDGTDAVKLGNYELRERVRAVLVHRSDWLREMTDPLGSIDLDCIY